MSIITGVVIFAYLSSCKQFVNFLREGTASPTPTPAATASEAPSSPLETWAAEYRAIYADYLAALTARGITLGAPHSQDQEKSQVMSRLAQKGAWIRNGGASVVSGAISPACEACTGAPGSETLTITLRCNRN